MRWKQMAKTLVALVVLSLVAGCDLDGCNADFAARAAGSIKPVRDARTGLCFMYTSERGGSRYGLSQVNCELAQHALQRNAAEGRQVTDRLNYGYVVGERGTLCLAYVNDDAGNLRSNLAVVPCEPVQQARQENGLPFTRFWP